MQRELVQPTPYLHKAVDEGLSGIGPTFAFGGAEDTAWLPNFTPGGSLLLGGGRAGRGEDFSCSVSKLSSATHLCHHRHLLCHLGHIRLHGHHLHHHLLLSRHKPLLSLLAVEVWRAESGSHSRTTHTSTTHTASICSTSDAHSTWSTTSTAWGSC